MKKYLYLALVAIACGAMIVACGTRNNPDDPGQGGKTGGGDPSTLDNTVQKCWQVTYTSNGQSATMYSWCTEAILVAACNEEVAYAKLEGETWTYTYKEADANDEASCLALNDDKPGQGGNGGDDETFYCWKVTQKITGNQTVTYYSWLTEATVEEQKKIYGENITFEKADADDKDSCVHKNYE